MVIVMSYLNLFTPNLESLAITDNACSYCPASEIRPMLGSSLAQLAPRIP